MGVDFRSPDGDGATPPQGAGRRIGIVCARWNDAITRRLLRGVHGTLAEPGFAGDEVVVAWGPGALAVPLESQAMARTGRYDAVIALGCVIRGDTAHFEYVAGPAADGVLEAQLSTGVPIIFGVLTVENRRQALVRSVVDADLEGDNKGSEAAVTALEMASVLESIRRG